MMEWNGDRMEWNGDTWQNGIIMEWNGDNIHMEIPSVYLHKL